MTDFIKFKEALSFGFEQTLTIANWWEDPGFTATSDTKLKREMMLRLTEEIVKVIGGTFKETKDIWDHMQYETFDSNGLPSFVVTMDPGSIEVKTWPCLAEDVQEMIAPLFIASEKAGLLPYRNWWYGIQGGTEGGCHVNMGGLTPASNPLKKNPSMVVKYAAYIHNRPFLHFPFMGLDVGPEGNAMRMDEKEGFAQVQTAFKKYREDLDPKETYSLFEKTNLIANKSSYPSLFKFKAPLYLIEDRGQEALRTPEDFKLIVDLRLKIFEILFHNKIEPLRAFDKSLHQKKLTSYSLWEDFQVWASENDLNPVPYQRFFDRQFPVLWLGTNAPTLFGMKEGRRPRIVKNIVKKGDTVISKEIDTSYKRFEFYVYANTNSKVSIDIEASGIEKKSDIIKHKGYLGLNGSGQAFYKYIDIKVDDKNSELKIKVSVDEKEQIATFHLQNMNWI
jgi:hypothetical protein